MGKSKKDSNQKQAADTGNVRISSFSRFRWPKKYTLFVLVFSLIVAAVTGAVFLINNSGAPDSQPVSNQDLSQKFEEAYDLANSRGNEVEAISSLETLLEEPGLTDVQRQDTLVAISTLYLNEGKTEKALESARQAQEVREEKSQNAAVAIGYAARRAGEYQEAIDNFQLVIKLNQESIKDESLSAGERFQLQSDENNYRSIINDLEKQL
ncbi:MAG: tetratricopeptide repeat protein [Candidatus Saccharibacteria bacterium]|nr:tetratricopeptide repeat protein [Candidatus Saccharibacteria bacterium]